MPCEIYELSRKELYFQLCSVFLRKGSSVTRTWSLFSYSSGTKPVHIFYALHNFVPASVPLSIVVQMLQILSDSKSFKYLYDHKCLPYGRSIVYILLSSPTAGAIPFKQKTIARSLSGGRSLPQTTRLSTCNVTNQLRFISQRNTG
jgi:hypothetical protein